MPVLRDARPGAVLRGARERDHAPRDRSGSSRRRLCGRHARGRLHVLHVSRPQSHARPRGADGTDPRRALRPGDGPAGRQGWLDAPDERPARRHGLLRDRRRPSADRPRRSVVRPIPEVRPGRGLLLRRWSDEYRFVPRGAEHGRGVESAGGLRLREQPVHGIHRDRRGDGGRAAGGGPGECVWARADHGGRQRRGRRPCRGGPCARPGTCGRGPVPHRGAHVPTRWPLPRRSRQVPAGRRGRGVESA